MKLLKKLLATLSCFSLIATTIPTSINAKTDNTFCQGDIDGNRCIEIEDIVDLTWFLNGDQNTTDGRQQQRLDVNEDKLIDKSDLDYLKDIFLHAKVGKVLNYTSSFGLVLQEPISCQVIDAQAGKLIPNYSYTINCNLKLHNNGATSNPGPLPNQHVPDTIRPIDSDSFKLSSIAGFNNGTAFAIDDHTFLTAAHVVWTNENLHKNKTIDLHNSIKGDVSLKVKYIHIPKRYLSGEAHPLDYKCDYAMVVVEDDLDKYIKKEDYFDIGIVSNNAPSLDFNIHKADSSHHMQGSLVRVYNDTIHYSANTDFGSGSPVYRNVNGKLSAIGITRAQIAEGGEGIRFNSDFLTWIRNNPSPYRY